MSLFDRLFGKSQNRCEEVAAEIADQVREKVFLEAQRRLKINAGGFVDVGDAVTFDFTVQTKGEIEVMEDGRLDIRVREFEQRGPSDGRLRHE